MKSQLKATIAVGAVCALSAIATTGIATSAAATKASGGTSTGPAAGLVGRGPGGEGGPGGHRGPGGPGGPRGGGIHSEQVVPDADGSGFATIVSDRGTLTAIDATTLTIKEGTATETYDTVDVVADGTVTVRRNGKKSSLAKLAVGDHVHVMKDGTTTRIEASTAAFEKKQDARREQARGPEPTWPTA